jgi:hypothetical protein
MTLGKLLAHGTQRCSKNQVAKQAVKNNHDARQAAGGWQAHMYRFTTDSYTLCYLLHKLYH